MDQEAVRLADDDGEVRHHGVALDRYRHREERADRPGQQRARRVLLGPRAQLADARAGDEDGAGQARPAGGGRSLSVGDRGHGQHAAGGGRQGQPEPRRVPAAGVHAVRDLGFVHGIEPLAAMAREGDRAAVRIDARPHADAGVRRQAWLRQGAVEELQDDRGQARRPHLDGAGARVDPARDQRQQLDHRLHRPVARTPEVAYAQYADVRRQDAALQAREGPRHGLRPDRRLFRPAVAVLWQPGAEASGLAQPV
ncbi:hypothetical protein D3C81_805950 [compost metagenome]